MKTCPVCNTHYEDTETVCPDCYSHQILLESPQIAVSPDPLPENQQIVPESSGYFQFTIDFFNHSLNLFTIIALITTILSIFPLFVTFILGENWFNQLLSDPTIGFQSLLLILIATFFGAAFVYYLMALVIVEYINHIRRSSNLHISEILFSASILSLVVISLGGLISFLWLVWFNKFDLFVYFYGIELLFLTMIPAFIIIISGIFRIFPPNCMHCINSIGWIQSLISCKNSIVNEVRNSRVITSISSLMSWIIRGIHSIRRGLTIFLCVVLFCLVIYVLYFLMFSWLIPTYNTISTLNDETSKYYSNKEVPIDLHYGILNQTNNTPIILSIKRNIDTNSTTNWSGFDEKYAQCHWSTNFGYFVTTSSDYSIITKHTQTLIVPRCLKNNDLVLWTYDLTDYNKPKPNVTIGLTLEDQNKLLKIDGNGVLGKANLSVSWSDFDTIRNESLNYTNIS